MKGVVFDIQRFSIHDGPGIRTLVFFKGCPMRCVWCANPESQKSAPELFFDIEKCNGCEACIKACTCGAVNDVDGRIVFSRELCTDCGLCADICPTGARSMKGREMTVSEIMREVEKDIDFYESSGGGVTLGGGEPLFHPGLAAALLAECRKVGIHTAIETAGLADWDSVKRVFDATDLVLFDVKHMDDSKHKAFTGVGNRKILENLKNISRNGNHIIVRTPVIPGFNDSAKDIKAICEFAADLDVDGYMLLPFHNAGSKKYRCLGREYQYEQTGMGDLEMEKLKSAAMETGITLLEQ